MAIIDQAAIDARNELNRTADRVEPDLQASMAAHTARKYGKSAAGVVHSAVAKKLATITAELPLRYRLIIRSEVTGIWAKLDLCYSRPEGGVNYINEEFRIGRRDDAGVLVEPEEQLTHPEGRKQYKLKEVKDTLNRAHQLESEAVSLRCSAARFRR